MTTVQPDPWLNISTELHKLADDVLALIGQPAPSCFSISIQPAPHNVPEVVPAVDTIAMALLGKRGYTRAMSRGGVYHRHAEGFRGPVDVAVYRQMPTPDPRDLELEELRARVAELEAAKPAPAVAALPVSPCDRYGCVYPAESRTCMRCGVVKQGAEDRRTCAAPGDQEHDHAMCEDAVAEEQEPGWTIPDAVRATRRDRIASGQCGTLGCPGTPDHDGDCNVPASAE